MPSKLTKELFIDKAVKIHGNRYDYSLVIYRGSTFKVKITCLVHGIFEQEPASHIRGRGCAKCYGNVNYTLEQFIKRATDTHNNKYNYSLVEYKNNHTKIKIICPEHGIFEQTPHNHLDNTAGCKKCSNKLKSELRSHTTDKFINKAKQIHGDKYDYSVVTYTKDFNKINIICKEHGMFEQMAGSHLQGTGCPKCNSSKGEEKIRNFLKHNNIQFEEQKRFAECIYKKPLPFDFYLPKQKILIEYDGEQHFKPIELFGGKRNFMRVNKHDSIKNCFAVKNKYDLLRIPYVEYNTIEEVLSKKLCLPK